MGGIQQRKAVTRGSVAIDRSRHKEYGSEVYESYTLVSLYFNPVSDMVNPSASITGPADGGVILEITGAFPFTASAARAAVVRQKKADPATPNFSRPFIDCFQFSCTVVGWTFEDSFVVLHIVERDAWNASQLEKKADKTISTVGKENMFVRIQLPLVLFYGDCAFAITNYLSHLSQMQCHSSKLCIMQCSIFFQRDRFRFRLVLSPMNRWIDINVYIKLKTGCSIIFRVKFLRGNRQQINHHGKKRK